MERLSKAFGPVHALLPTDLAIPSGEFLTLLGPSGSGKTTLLNICAGYIPPTAGRLLVDGRDITATPPARRNMGMVFQNYALFPHMNVAENVAYGLQARGRPRAEIALRVQAALERVQLATFGTRPVRQLSGGQQQRVALARAMVIEPDILLMDEPLGALDRQLRREVQLEIRRLHLATPRTTIYVTHDQEEALVMSDRIAVMRAGSIVQVGAALDLYERPANAFVARFLGESNLLAGRVATLQNGQATIEVPGLESPIRGHAAPGLVTGQPAVALIRPETIRTAPTGVPATLLERIYLGELEARRYRLPGGQDLWARRLAGTPDPDPAFLAWTEDRLRILPEPD